MSTTIHSEGVYRIVEEIDYWCDMDDLKGDCYKPEVNPDVPADKLKREELEFEHEVISLGVYGYRLQKWKAEVGAGWEDIDSCWGFVGTYCTDREHDIVAEMKATIKAGDK